MKILKNIKNIKNMVASLLYLLEGMKKLTKGRQTPTTTKPNTVPDFPAAVRK